MDYSQASKRFDLDKFISRISDLDIFELSDELNNEIARAEEINIARKTEFFRDIENMQYTYISHLKKFAYILNQGMRPAGADKRLFDKFIPVVTMLIGKGQLGSEILELFN